MDCNGLRRSHGQTFIGVYGPEIGPAQRHAQSHLEDCDAAAGRAGGARYYGR